MLRKLVPVDSQDSTQQIQAVAEGGKPGLGAGEHQPLGTGIKFRAHPLGIGVASVQLDRLDELNERRGDYIEEVEAGLTDIPCLRPVPTYAGVQRGGYYGFPTHYLPDELGGLPCQTFREALRAAGVKAGGGALALSAIPVTLIAGDEVAEDEALAQAMGYFKDAAKVDTAKFPKRAGEKGAKQLCNNCALFAGEADAELAPCSIFQNRNVRGLGWCNAWVAKS